MTAATSKYDVVLEQISAVRDDVKEIKIGVKEAGDRLRNMEIAYSATCQRLAGHTEDIEKLEKTVDARKTIDNWWNGINSFFVIIAGIIGGKSP